MSSNRFNSLKYLRSLSCQDVGIRKSEIGAKTQFLSLQNDAAICFLKSGPYKKQPIGLALKKVNFQTECLIIFVEKIV